MCWVIAGHSPALERYSTENMAPWKQEQDRTQEHIGASFRWNRLTHMQSQRRAQEYYSLVTVPFLESQGQRDSYTFSHTPHLFPAPIPLLSLSKGSFVMAAETSQTCHWKVGALLGWHCGPQKTIHPQVLSSILSVVNLQWEI